MKYINCPQCNNKIIDRNPLKCLYCGYDSSKIEEEKLELLDPPTRPNKQSYVNVQTISLLVSMAGAIAFLITFLYTKTTVVDNVLVEVKTNMNTLRYILGIIAAIAFATFVSTTSNYEKEENNYRNKFRRIAEINKRIEKGAKLSDFDEADAATIMKAQKEKKAQQQTLNQQTSKYIYKK